MPLSSSITTDHFFEYQQSDLTKRQKKQAKRNKRQTELRCANLPPSIRQIKAKTITQEKTIDAFNDNKNLLLHGSAGTGKTFLAMYLALNSVITGQAPKPIVIIRSIVPGRDIGFLPGSVKEKAAVYEAPYSAICGELILDKPNSYSWLKDKNYIEFATTSFLRGITYINNIIIVDECQNLNDGEINTIMTRVGDGCRIIFCGDFNQRDYLREGSGMPNLLKVAANMPSFTIVRFDHSDIVRSGFVREYIMTRSDLENRGVIA